jgi:inorganic pyrophosphatase
MLDALPAYHSRSVVNAVIETPRGSRNKFTFDPEIGGFRLGKQLPAGWVFPFDFGFVPSTLGDDGDPLDVLVLLETPTFTGCVVQARVIGVIDGEETSKSGKKARNPRIIAVAVESTEYAGLRRIDQVPGNLVDEITQFFVSYNAATGKTFRATGTHGSREAIARIDAGMRQRGEAARDGVDGRGRAARR